MFVLNTCRSHNTLISYKRNKKFRDDLIVFPKRFGHAVFMTTFNNSYRTYEVISVAVPNGTYKIKVIPLDNINNEGDLIEDTVIVSFFPLPPKNLRAILSGYTVTLTWQHSSEGAPDSYVIYGNNGSGNIDKDNPIATISGSLLTYTFVVGTGQWQFVIDSIKNGRQSDNLRTVSLSVPVELTIPPKPGLPGTGPFAVTGLVLTNVSVGKVNIRFYWPNGNQASSFNVYHNSGSGEIDYETVQFNFNRTNSLIQSYTTTQLHSDDEDKTYKFAVRAVNSYGVEEENEDEYEIIVDGAAPDPVTGLTLDTIF